MDEEIRSKVKIQRSSRGVDLWILTFDLPCGQHPLHNPLPARYLHAKLKKSMIRDPFDGMSGDELDPQAAESAQLTALGMHAVDPDADDDEEDDDLDEEAAVLPDEEKDPDALDPADDLNKDGLAELEEMEVRLRAEEPVLDFAIVEEE